MKGMLELLQGCLLTSLVKPPQELLEPLDMCFLFVGCEAFIDACYSFSDRSAHGTQVSPLSSTEHELYRQRLDGTVAVSALVLKASQPISSYSLTEQLLLHSLPPPLALSPPTSTALEGGIPRVRLQSEGL